MLVRSRLTLYWSATDPSCPPCRRLGIHFGDILQSDVLNGVLSQEGSTHALCGPALRLAVDQRLSA